STDDKTLLGIGTATFTYDTCANGVGRLCEVDMPDARVVTAYAYDAEGNDISTSRHVQVGGLNDTRVATATFGPGGHPVEEAYVDHAVGQPGTVTRARFAYDDRALPSTMTWLPAAAPVGAERVVGQQVRNVAGQVITRSANLAGLGDGWKNF